jgi:hypothetical protein
VKASSSFLEERTKALLFVGAGAAAKRARSFQRFCLLFQKEVLASLEGR